MCSRPWIRQALSPYAASVLVVVSILFTMHSAPVATRIQYSNTELHYSFILPEGWREISNAKIGELATAVSAEAGVKAPKYVAGFQQSPEPDIEYPYLLIQHHNVRGTSLSALAKAFTGIDQTEDVRKLSSSEIVHDTNFGKPLVDEERKMVAVPLTMDVAGVGPVRALIAVFPGQMGLSQLNFYTRQGEYDQHAPLFLSIVDTFRFDVGYSYDRRGRSHGTIWEKALIGAVVGAVIALIATRLRRRQRQSEA